MILSPTRVARRRAAIAPLTAILLIPLLALTAFAVDMGYIVLIQSDLQNAADSAALAGSNKLMNGYVQYNLPGQSSANQSSILSSSESSASASAQQFAGLNNAGVTGLTLLSSDIQYGFTDASGNYTAYSADSTLYPNTIKVTLRRDNTANTPLGLFFGPAVGTSSVNLTASAAATIYAANINSFANTSSIGLAMLPMTYDVNAWNSFLATGQDPDGNTTLDANGNPEITVYPSVKDTGNFGLLGLDDQHAGASTVSSWITSGLTQTAVQDLLSNSASDETPLIPLSQHNPNILPSASTDGMGSWNWLGDTGLKTSVIQTIETYVGGTYLLPLFTPLDPGTEAGATYVPGISPPYTAGNGEGSHYYYNIVQFVSVTITADNGHSVVVQPSATVLNPSWVIMSSVVPAGTGTGAASTTGATTFALPKLTQ